MPKIRKQKQYWKSEIKTKNVQEIFNFPASTIFSPYFSIFNLPTLLFRNVHHDNVPAPLPDGNSHFLSLLFATEYFQHIVYITYVSWPLHSLSTCDVTAGKSINR